MKRANEYSQIRREEYDKLDEQESEAGTFKRASEEVLRQRRIVKARRPPSLRPVEPKLMPSSTGNQSLAEEPSPANPFAGISLVNGPTSISPDKQPFVTCLGSTSLPTSAHAALADDTMPGNLNTDPGAKAQETGPEEKAPKEEAPVDEAVGDAESASEGKANGGSHRDECSAGNDNMEELNFVETDRLALKKQPDAEGKSK